MSRESSSELPSFVPTYVSNFGLTIRFVFVPIIIVLFTSVATVALWAHDHLQHRQDALQARAQLVLRDLAQALETRLSLGLPLSQLPDVERLLDAARMQLPESRSAGIVDESGRVLFSTDAVGLGDAFYDFKTASPAQSGYAKRSSEGIYWLTVNTDDGALAGAVLLRLPIAVSDKALQTLAVSLALSATPPLAALLVLAVAIGIWLARAAGRRPAATALALDRLRRKAALPLEGDCRSLPEIPLQGFVAVVSERHLQLADAERALGQLDEMA